MAQLDKRRLGSSVLRFCPKCNTLLTYEQRNGKIWLACPKCGFEEETEEAKIQEEYRVEKKVSVIGKDERRARRMPTEAVECPKCSYGTAYWWMVQTRGGDESTTQFFRCKKCDHTWRRYS